MATSAPRRLIVLTLVVLAISSCEAFRLKTHTALSDLTASARLTDAESNAMEDKSESKASTRATVMIIAKPRLAGRLVITRPSINSSVLNTGTPRDFTLGKKFREYFVMNGPSSYSTATENCINPAFTRKGDGRMCGVGLFSGPHTCTYITDARLIPDHAAFDKLKPASNRGLGIEFEFVARKQARNLAGIEDCWKKITRNLTPRNLGYWNWEEDNSVTALTSAEARSVGAPTSETEGVPFEVTSPGPPRVPSGINGFKATIDMLTSLRHMGLQAGPSQGFHVHTNVFGNAGGTKLYRRQVFYVWAAWAKFQFAIDEMFSPSRPGSHFAQRLFLGNCGPISGQFSAGWKCTVDPCGCNRRFFGSMHKWLKDNPSQGGEYDKPGSTSTKKFCNTIMTTPGSEKACENGHPHQRYFQVNLVPMNKFGTMEFRAHSGTYSRGRVLRWIQFVVAFVDRFGLGGGADTQMSRYFPPSSGSPASLYRKLQRAQQSATSDELFKELGSKVATDSKAYYQLRKWETSSTKGCDIGSVNTWRADAGVGGDACGTLRPPAASLLQEESQEEYDAWHTPKVISTNNRTMVMQVSVPSNREPGSYLMVEMPQGNVRAERLHEQSVRDGIHRFTYELTDEDIADQSM